MVDLIRALRRGVVTLQGLLRSVDAQHVNREQTKQPIRDFVDTYFRDQRRGLRASGASDADLATIDAHLQDLLRFTHARTSTRDYRSLLTKLKKSLDELEVTALPLAAEHANGHRDHASATDATIITTLEGVCTSAALSYRQALADLHDSARVSRRGTAVELREALRETLDTLAPDREVRSEPGFKLEKDAKGPTMRQKASFLLRSRKQSKSAVATVTKTIGVVEEQTGGLLRSVYERGSASVHGSPSRDEVVKLKRHVATALAELLEIPE